MLTSNEDCDTKEKLTTGYIEICGNDMLIAYDYGGYSYILALRRWSILFANMRLESWKKIILWHGEIV